MADTDIREFWNAQADRGIFAGTRDVIAKQLEIEAIAAYVGDGMRVLDVGCGNGATAIELARRFRVHVVGLDFADRMIEAARKSLAGQVLRGGVEFAVGDVRSLPGPSGPFDLAYSERTLINLPDWASQRGAIADIVRRVRPGGLYVMCENSQDGLDAINALRERAGLPPITPPWHNRYLRDAEVREADIDGARLETVNAYTSTYYFLSRVVNAWLAKEEGQEPEYEAPVNRLALRLPPIGDFGQGKIWLWRRLAEDGRR